LDGCQVVIMAGGQGERLWPLSTASRPKQFQRLLAGRGTPFEGTFARALDLVGEASSVWTVTRRAYVNLIRNEVAGFEPANIIAEPCQRNTAPCIALAAALIRRRRPEADVAVFMPADHHVADREAMVAALKTAVSEARRTQAIVCLGVVPSRPHTGYGYIEATGPKPGEASLPAGRFTEKPDEERARQFMASGRHFWNAGIFVWPLAQVAPEFARHQPEIARFMEELRQSGEGKLAERFAALPEISVDYAVMERTENIRLVPLACGWNDLGSFSALAEAQGRDAAGNAVFAAAGAAVVAEEVRESVLHLGTPRRIALCGLAGAIVVDTPEALLVCARGYEDRIKELGRKAEAKGPAEPGWDHRPWGLWERLALQPGFQVKRIRVKPGHRLSLQAHQHRAEHWVVVAGSPEVEVDGRPLQLAPGEHVLIPARSRHRLANPGPGEVVIIEVQLGEVLAEDDIVRFEDDYGRAGEAF
jgi:mannose-1-phosphate guanylyltransferase/mannose-6-phosphate isomerase